MLFIGDIHGKFESYEKIIDSCDKSIQVGDFGLGFGHTIAEAYILETMKTSGNHRFIRGNHDNPKSCKNHPYWIKDGTCENDIMFVGGAHSIDYFKRIENVDWWSDEELSIVEFEKIFTKYSLNKPKIMVTHDCPKIAYHEVMGYSRVLKTRTSQLLDLFFEAHQPDLWIFGHHHDSRRVSYKGTEFICLAELETVDIDC